MPGEARPLRAELRVGGERLGRALGRLPATRRWERADQDLLELFASEIAVAIRNAQLFATVEAQNAQLLELDEAKDDFLRGVSHNLQTPLDEHPRLRRAARDASAPDRRLGIIAEQTDRLSRMVRQLLTVTRLESGALRPRQEVARRSAPRVRRDLGGARRRRRAVRPRRTTPAAGWPSPTRDQLDQVALGAPRQRRQVRRAGRPIDVTIAAEPAERQLRVTIADGGPGVAERRPGAAVRAASSAAAERLAGEAAAASGSTCRASSVGRWAATSSSSRGGRVAAPRFSDACCPAEPGEES